MGSWSGDSPIDEEMPEFLRIPLSDVEIGVQIGRGGFSTVHKASWRGKPCAAKVVQTADVAAIQREVSILSKLSHPNVVGCLGFSVDGVGDPRRCMILMELLERDLRGLMDERLVKNPSRGSPFSETESVDIMCQIAIGMEYLHGHGVFHGDLKASNILVSHGSDGELVVKITDFGVSQMVKVDGAEKSEEFMKKKHFRGVVGTRGYQAPEVSSSSVPFYGESLTSTFSYRAPEVFGGPVKFPLRSQRKPAEFYTAKADIYCFAMTCYEILSGCVPFEFVRKADIPALVLQGVRPELPRDLDSRLRSLVTKCWDPKPTARPRFSDIKYILNDWGQVSPGLWPYWLSREEDNLRIFKLWDRRSKVQSQEETECSDLKPSEQAFKVESREKAPKCCGRLLTWFGGCRGKSAATF